jgi:hypothetical protein
LRVAEPQTIEYFGAELPAWPEEFWPDAETPTSLSIAHGKVIVEYMPYSHTTSDLVVRLPAERVVITGDLLLQGWLAFTDVDNGGTMRGLVASMDKLVLAIRKDDNVIPGHNAAMTREETAKWVASMRSALAYVAVRAAQGLSLAEVQAAAVKDPSEGGLPADVQALASELIPLAPFVEWVYRDVTERDQKALLAARQIATQDEVSGQEMVSAILIATAGPENAASTEYDTLAFQVHELQAIDALGIQEPILSPKAIEAFAIYTRFVEVARADGRTSLTPEEYRQMTEELGDL